MPVKFKSESLFFNARPIYFTNETAPDWLTGVNTVKGSTMDARWFWEDHVLKLKIGESIKTDFNNITRVE